MSQENKKHVYRCQGCLQSVVTLMVDHGVTPLFIPCLVSKGCRHMMQHSGDGAPSLPHHYVWFKPQYLNRYRNPADHEHFNLGGLDLKRRDPNWAEIAQDSVIWVRERDTVTPAALQRQYRQTFVTAHHMIDRMIMNGVLFAIAHEDGSYDVVREVPWPGDR